MKMRSKNLNPEDQQLAASLKEGSEEAFSSLFRKYGKRLYHFCYGYLKSREDAEGMVQETFIKVWESRASLDPGRPFEGFLFTIAYRLVLNRLRKMRYELSARLLLESRRPAVVNDTEEAVLAAELDGLARAAISGLPPRRQEIFHMVREDNMSYQQVAERLQISVKTVEAQMSAALRHLRKEIVNRSVLVLLGMLFY